MFILYILNLYSLINIIIENITTTSYGAGLYLTNKNILIKNCFFRNLQSSQGGAIYLNFCDSKIYNSCFFKCVSTTYLGNLGGNVLFSINGNFSLFYISTLLCSYITSNSGDSTIIGKNGIFIINQLNNTQNYGRRGGSVGHFELSFIDSQFKFINCIKNNEYCSIASISTSTKFQFINIINNIFSDYLLVGASLLTIENSTLYGNSKNSFYNNVILLNCIGDFSYTTILPSLFTQKINLLINEGCILENFQVTQNNYQKLLIIKFFVFNLLNYAKI